jgi:hypothetical protein
MRWRWVTIPLVVAVVSAGVVVGYPHYSHWQSRRTYLSMLADPQESGDPQLTASVNHNPDAAFAAGHRACQWASDNPQLPRDGELRTHYVELTNPPDLGAGQQGSDIAGYIAETAWNQLCHLHFAESDD